jgi:tetratricopeptide (TPR) repeat protein
MCQYYLGNFKESIQALKHLHNQQPDNLNLIYQIGYINLVKMDNPREALHYLTLGKKLFKNNLGSIYGKAFEIVMDPADAPNIYFHIFQARAEANLRMKRYKDAVTDCNWAIFLRPLKGEPYHQRALANVRQQKVTDVCEDINRAIELGVAEAKPLRSKFCENSIAASR